MPSKLVRFYSRAFVVSSALLVGVTASNAWATLYVTPVNLNYGVLTNAIGTTFYYPTAGNFTTAPVLDSSSPDVVPNVLDLSTNFQFGSGTVDLNQAMIFSIVSNTATFNPPSGYKLLLMAFTTVNGAANTTQPVPFVAANDTGSSATGFYLCQTTQGYPQGRCDVIPNISSTGLPSGALYTYGYQYTQGQTVSVAILPADVCKAAFVNGGGQAQGCDTAGNVVGQTGTNNRAMSIKFYLVYFPLSLYNISTNLTTSTFNPTTDVSQIQLQTSDNWAASISFQSASSAASCPSSTDPTVYFPGNESISLNTTLFGVTGGPIGAAPATKLILVGNNASSASPAGSPRITLDLTNYTSSEINQAPIGGNQVVGNFQNSSINPTQNFYYDVGILVRDAAGFVATPPTSGTTPCIYQNIRASADFGFLAKSNCFIATAAFGGPKSPPVEMLRVFRDKILYRSQAGRDFVHWYYSWSPAAADWIRENSFFRYPVQVALIPLLIFAWMTLHPMAAGAVMAGAATTVLALKTRRRWRVGQ